MTLNRCVDGKFHLLRVDDDELQFTGMLLVEVDNDAFQDRVFADVPEENAPEAHSAFADDQQTIRIETADGHRFFVSIYPSYGYLYSSGAMAYHQITPQLAEWINEYLE